MTQPQRLLRGKGSLLLVLIVVCGSIAASPSAGVREHSSAPTSVAPPDSITLPHVLGEVLVGFRTGTSDSSRFQAHSLLDAVVIDRVPAAGVDVVRSRRGEATDVLIQRYLAIASVEYAQPNYLYKVTANPPNDPKFGQQWALNNIGQIGTCNAAGTFDVDIDAPEAWDLQTGSSGTLVAVIDTGVNYNHLDLAANIWANPGEANCTNHVDDDLNNYVDDCRGWDFVNNDNAPLDDRGHGTHVAGIIGAVGNNAYGISGIAWTVRLMPLKVFGTDGTGNSGWIANAIYYARDKLASVINFSASFQGPDPTVNTAIALSPGVLFVTAAFSQGGGGQDQDVFPSYPCNSAYANIVCVTDTDQSDARDPLANWGLTSVDLGAPGVNILSTAIPGAIDCFANYDPFTALACCTGTSMAAPHVAGVAALMFATRPSLTVAQAKTILINTVDPIAALAGKSVSGGRLNAFKAVRSAGDTTLPSAPTNLDAHYDSGQGGATLSWTASNDNIGVHHYEIHRTPRITVGYTMIGTSPSTAFLDTSAVTNPVTAYLYKVRAVDAAGNLSDFSNVDLATAIAYTDEALNAGVSSVRAVHVTELRGAVNAIRIVANLSASGWTDNSLGGILVKAVHVAELRSALTPARTALGYSDPPFTDPTLTSGVTLVKAIHITQLRDRTK